jgi:transcriptional regulator with XRE-family HTH domain
MELHHGQTVERIIRRNGYSIAELARIIQVNRRSVYNWFNQRHLKPEIIFRIGSVLNHDFSSEFPSLFVKGETIGNNKPHYIESAENATGLGDSNWKDKYIELLEKYNELLQFCIKNKSTVLVILSVQHLLYF